MKYTRDPYPFHSARPTMQHAATRRQAATRRDYRGILATVAAVIVSAVAYHIGI